MPADARRWAELVRNAPVQDAYFMPGYATAYQAAETAEAIALHLHSADTSVLLPIMLRRWERTDGSPVLDAFSPYGYGGWLRLAGEEVPTPEVLLDLLAQVKHWAQSQGSVCCVLRLHPLLPQSIAFERLLQRTTPDVYVSGGAVTCAINLKSWDVQGHRPQSLARRRRSYLNAARRTLQLAVFDGKACTGPDADRLEEFRLLYDADMERLGAPEFLRFSPGYFPALAEGLGKDFLLTLAYAGEALAGGVIFLFGTEFGHYHLSSTNELGRLHRAATFLTVAGAEISRDRGCSWLHLGGGMRPGDSLFEFKASFGGQQFYYRTTTVIADEKRYQELVADPRSPWPYHSSAGRPEKGLIESPKNGRAESIEVPRQPATSGRQPLKIIFLGKNKPSACEALRYLVGRGCKVVASVAPPNDEAPWSESLASTARELGIPSVSDVAIYEQLATGAGSLDLVDVDLVISFLFWKRIKSPLIQLPRIGCLNFHPAPLPEFRGVGGYNIAILEGLTSWGVSAHFVDEHFDTGDLIEVRRFPIEPERLTAFSLERQSLGVMLGLLKSVMAMPLAGVELPRTPQGPGRYIDRAEFERLRRIAGNESAQELARKTRAFWYPPHQGAFIEIGGKEYTLVDEDLLGGEICDLYRGHSRPRHRKNQRQG